MVWEDGGGDPASYPMRGAGRGLWTEMDEMDGMDFMDPAWEQARACDGFLSIWSIMSIQSIWSM